MILSKKEVIKKFDRNRKCWLLRCDHCSKKFYRPKRLIKSEAHYCSRKCRSASSKQQVELKCDYCRNTFYRQKAHTNRGRHGLNFCCRKCKDTAQSLSGNVKKIQPSHYGSCKSTSSYRKRAFFHYGAICSHCGYKKSKKMLDVHHMDENRDNNDKRNLIVLCVWCHGLITRGLATLSNRKLVLNGGIV